MLDAQSLGPLVLAPVAGSFLGVVVQRFPGGSPTSSARSCCESCGAVIAWYDLIPVVSWLMLKGRCRRCAASIGLVPIGMELGAVLIALTSVALLPPAAAWFGCLLGWLLLAASAVDATHLVVPDKLSVPLVPLGILAAEVVAPGTGWLHAAGAVAGGGLFWALGRAYRGLRGQDGLGDADIILAAAAGAWLGPAALPAVILLAALAGIGTLACTVAAGRATVGWGSRIPFAPALGLATWILFVTELGPMP